MTTRAGMWDTFTAIDFETANLSRDSACAVGLARVEAGAIVEKHHCLIRSPTSEFFFAGIHGISWSDVRRAPSFEDVWPEAAPLARGVELLAAHNASFDRSVRSACARTAGLPAPVPPFRYTVQLACERLETYPTTLPDVRRRLGIPLRHDDGSSDAGACTRIVLAAGPGEPPTSGRTWR